MMMKFEEKIHALDVACRACKITTNKRELTLIIKISEALDKNEDLTLRQIIDIQKENLDKPSGIDYYIKT